MTTQLMYFFTRAIIPVAFLITTGSAKAAEKHGMPKPRYGHCVDVGLGGCETGNLAKTGKGYAVCETYLKHINLLKELPKCEAPVPPGFKQPVWEELEISSHLQLAYQAETLHFSIIRSSYKRPDYEAWQKQLVSEMQAGKISPQLRKTTVQPFGEKSITLLAYTRDRASCKTVAIHDDSQWADPGHVYFLLTADPQNPVREIRDRISRSQSELMQFAGKPYFVRPNLYYPGYEIIAFDLEMTDTSARVATMNAFYAKFGVSQPIDTTKKYDPDPNVYWAGQLCHFLPSRLSKR